MEILSRVVTIRIYEFFRPSKVFQYPSMTASFAYFCGAPDMLLICSSMEVFVCPFYGVLLLNGSLMPLAGGESYLKALRARI